MSDHPLLHKPQAPWVLAHEELAHDQSVAFPFDPAAQRSNLFDWARRTWRGRSWLEPLILFVASLAIFSLFSWERILEPSDDPHFAYLATTYVSMAAVALGDEEAVARRQGLWPFELEHKPPHQNDWASWWELHLRGAEDQVLRGFWFDTPGRGRFKTLDGQIFFVEPSDIDHRASSKHTFVSFPPGPAMVMVPLAAVWGYEINDVFFTVFFAALNVALLYVLLRRLSRGGRTGRGRREILWLTVLFGFGTAHLWCSVLGQVWFTALIIGVTCTLLYLLASIDARHPFLAGLALALGFATRTPLLFSCVFFLAFVLFPGGTRIGRHQLGWALRKLGLFGAPCIAMGLALLWMNQLRFGHLSEFGHTYLADGSLDRIKTYGLFNAAFLSKNLSAMFTLVPRLEPREPYITVSKHGMSLLLTTPAFLWLLWPMPRVSRADKLWWRALWVAALAVGIPAVFYQNTGYEQFGYRFSLDYTPYLIALLAVGRRPLSLWFKAAVVFGIGINAFGAITFKRMGKFYSELFFV